MPFFRASLYPQPHRRQYKKTLESTSFLYAFIELLIELGLMYQDPEYDEYTFAQESDVDCESRLDTCKALCCKLPFALSKLDMKEGIIRYGFGRHI
jgi:hypothetical protein